MLFSPFPSTTSFAKYYDSGKTSLQQAAISIIRKGQIPKHIGIILDGNRRFAKKMDGSSTFFGHKAGFNKLTNVAQLCSQLGLCELTVYAFSIENFKRPKEEVDYIMELLIEAFTRLSNRTFSDVDYDIRVQVLGKLEYFPKEVAVMAKKVMEDTKNNKGMTLNICCPYTSRDEMATSINKNVEMIKDGQLDLSDVSQNTIEQHLFTSHSPPLDVIIRTSGETRLSDFLLYQANHGCQIHFVNCCWPEFSIWQLLPIFIEYQIYRTD